VPGHPHFASEIVWHARLADALAEARASGKRVFVAHGGARCAGTRALVEKVLAKDEIAEYVAANYVAVASDVAAPDPDVAALLAQIPKREPTPVCIYLDASGKLLSSTAGGRPPAVLLNDLVFAHAR
jgi:hypothetical protein